MTLTAAIITRKAVLNPRLLQSLSFADEILVVVDSPVKLPVKASRKIKIYFRALNGDFAAQRNFALQKAKKDWVLFVDDDEYVGTELAREIKLALATNKYSAFLIPRLDVVFHQPLLYGETGHLKLLRLARRQAGQFKRSVHETWKITGRIGELSSPLYHQKDFFISGFLARMSQYSQIDAQMLSGEGKPFSWFRLFCYPLLKFKMNYFFKAGFLDGLPGLFLSYLLGVQSLSVRVIQWEKQD